jgi:capsular polysaccharide biosynthesis protein
MLDNNDRDTTTRDRPGLRLPGDPGDGLRSATEIGRPDRGAVLRRWWWLVALIAVIAGALTYAISRVVPPQFSSSATASVNVTGADPSQNSTAANNIASQYAQYVNAQRVIESASINLSGPDARGLSLAVSGGTVAGQNVVQVKAVGSSAGQAERRASAVMSALTAYVDRLSSQQSSSYTKSALGDLGPINREIRQVTRQLSKESGQAVTSSRSVTLQQTLSTLVAQRSAATVTIAQNATGGKPSLVPLASAGAGSQVAPRPTLYAAIAFLLALIVASQLIVYVAGRRPEPA